MRIRSGNKDERRGNKEIRPKQRGNEANMRNQKRNTQEARNNSSTVLLFMLFIDIDSCLRLAGMLAISFTCENRGLFTTSVCFFNFASRKRFYF